ncbi:arylsulphatase A [Lentisphaera araneosa HTCC2155]|uniref:Arylsulphatase A n=1 Tax=Lentisphaera araneosa HTCC2155 TaxID=313628 RepID=A6DR28_9BACT|nr:sulfatase-like hydrolase/transferase [Lentisphaera araneosa]EDM25916.1 arylsulphatase A [Lentisphaera araneosa HTCC2155]
MIKSLFTLVIFCGLALQAREATDKPNIIFVLLDDLGKEWINCYGGENIKTPRIDQLAEQGLKFDNAYSMPQCTPSRVAFMTGQYPYRSGWVNHWDSPRWGAGYYDWNKNPSIARTMKSAGYTTAVAGKWQLNDFRIHPDAMVKHGFDDYCMWTGCEGSTDKKHENISTQRYWNPYIHTKEGSKTYPGKFGPDIYNQFLLDFISENKDKPFFIYYPMALPHGPLVHTPLEPNVKDKYAKHKAMVHYIDLLTGKLVDHLNDLKIRENTIIVWTCDNGTSGGINNNMNGREVKGGKTKTTENGVNTPFIVSWPGIIPEGKTSKAIVDFTDMHQTFADFAGAKIDPNYTYDGKSAKEVFLGAPKSQREWIMAMGSKPARMTDKGVENVYYFRDRVVRDTRYKLFISTDRKPEKLYDLEKDPAELNDLINNPEYKAVLDRLSQAIKTFPETDNDPTYTKLETNPWDKKSAFPSKIHKQGHPDQPEKFKVKAISKKKKSKKEKK